MGRKTQTKTRTQTSVENGIKILKNAIDNKVSVSEASRRENFGRNYVSTIKSRLQENYDIRAINRDMYREFRRLVKQYNAMSV
jgi:hypothetical protein